MRERVPVDGQPRSAKIAGSRETDASTFGELSVFLEGYNLTPQQPDIEVRPDGTLSRDIVDVIYDRTWIKEGSKPKVWKDILIYLGLAAAGGVAVF